MRPYTVVRETARGGAARPLVLASVLCTVILVLLYFLINFPVPMTTTTETTTVEAVLSSTPITETSPVKTEEDLYAHIDEEMHRRQIPLIHMPYLYQIRFKLFIPWKTNVTFGKDNFSVQGHLRMHFTSGGGSRILLHSDATQQHIGDTMVTDEFGRQITIKHAGREHTQVLDLHLTADMISGMNYTLDIAFRGHISLQKQKGLFAVPYANKTKYVVGTQLQMSEARTMFPCIDVPEVKASFETVIVHPSGTTAISNMMDNSTETDGEWTTTIFHKTPPMPTYLFALSVSDFPYLESKSSRGVRTRVYCDPDKIENAELLVNTTGPLITFFEEYFGIPYPLDKLGMCRGEK
ncbi:unnamed protein product [Caenorhabditis bovis]|uniref:Aminopeptidase N-like N-terminal domain-containing protein n=1 Tax=Caenorhabditis bovis TaxID=2654633 RepID=A0A8S1EJ38_9PELO|nr:unnamed protein product [Caenorhabditis bovis]